MRRGLDDEERAEEGACLLEAGMEIWRWHSLDNPGWNTELLGTYRATSRDFWASRGSDECQSGWREPREKWTKSMNVHLNVYKLMCNLIVESPLDCKDLQVANVVALLHRGQFLGLYQSNTWGRGIDLHDEWETRVRMHKDGNTGEGILYTLQVRWGLGVAGQRLGFCLQEGDEWSSIMVDYGGW